MKQLTEDLKNTYWHVYFDNFSASVDLALDLHRAGLYSCATLRTNRRHYPGDLKVLAKKDLKEATVGLYRMVICCDVWQDSCPVVLIATNSNTTKTETVKEKKRDCTFTYYKCPSSLSVYNRYMGGVNHNDQLRGYYNVHLKCRKYYKTSGFVESRHYLLSYVLYQS